MRISRRTIVTAGASTVLTATASALAAERAATDQEVAELVARSEQANAALLRGDAERYRSLVTLTDGFTLMSPFGGRATRAVAVTEESWQAMARFFRNGTLRQELVAAYGTAGMVVLAVIEHGHGEVGGLPAQDWPLRVTLVFRREGGEWRLAHRHADPLARGISLREAAALAAGAR